MVSESDVKKGISAESQQQTLATILSDTLGVDYDTVLGKIQNTDSGYEIIAQKVDKDVSRELYEKLNAAGCTGVYSEPDTKRYYQQGSFLVPRCWAMSTATTTAPTDWNLSITTCFPAPRAASCACRTVRIRM